MICKQVQSFVQCYFSDEHKQRITDDSLTTARQNLLIKEKFLSAISWSSTKCNFRKQTTTLVGKATTVAYEEALEVEQTKDA